MARERRKPAKNDRKRIIKKKTSILATENITYVDYKDVNLLRRFMSERAKIRARRGTGNTQPQQAGGGRVGCRRGAGRHRGGRRGGSRSRGGRRGGCLMQVVLRDDVANLGYKGDV